MKLLRRQLPDLKQVMVAVPRRRGIRRVIGTLILAATMLAIFLGALVYFLVA